MTLLVDIALGLGLLYIIFLLYQKWALPAGFPPGPPVLPIVGSIPFVGTVPPVAFKNMRSKYGDIIGLKMGELYCLALNNLDLIREAFNEPAFTGAFVPPPLRPILVPDGKNGGLIHSEGKDWSEQRRFALRNLRDLGFGKKSMEGMTHENINVLIENLKELAGQSINPARKFSLAGLNSLWHIIAGERFELDDPKFQEIVDATNEAQRASASGGLALIIPWLAELIPKISGVDKFRTAVPAVRALIQGHIDEHKKTFQPDAMRDFMDVYINEINSSTDSASSFYKGNGDANMVVGTQNLFEAGAETTSSTINWSIFYLCKNLDVQKKVQNEIDSVVGSFRLPSLNDRPNMPYTEAVMLEVFRMSSLVPLGVPHRAMEDTEFHGYKIPSGTIVFANLYAHHYDEKIWGDPETFRPTRFLTEDGKAIAKGHPPIAPFSVGKRSCLGETLARNNYFLFLTSILQRFTVTQDPNSKEGKEPVGIFRLPPEINVIFEDRLDSK
jgi:cytochrome P450